jgi:hypothetical protein
LKLITEYCEEVVAPGFKFRKHNEISDTNITTISHLSSMPLAGKNMLLIKPYGICKISTVMLNLRVTQQWL